MEPILFYLHNMSINASMILYAALTLVAGKLLLMILNKFHEKMATGLEDNEDHIPSWKAIIMQSIYTPLRWIIYVCTLTISMDLLVKDSLIISNKIETATEAFIIICLVWFILRFIKKAGDKWGNESTLDRNSANFITKLLQVLIIAIGVELSLEVLGLSTSGLLAFGSIGGAAIAFASQDLLSNFFGGLIIHLDKPFDIGDSIETQDKKITGEIKHIGWRMTHIITSEKQLIYVPNAIFTKSSIKNTSHVSCGCVYETIIIEPIEPDIFARITDEIHTMLNNLASVIRKQDITIYLNAISLSGMHLSLRIYTKKMSSTDLHYVKQDILLKSYDIILKNGAKLAIDTDTSAAQ